MLDNTENIDLMDRTPEMDDRLTSQVPSSATTLPKVGEEDSLYIDESGAVVARNARFAEAQTERMDLFVVERADGRPVLELSAMVPEHFAGCHAAAKTQIAQYVPDSENFSAVSFGDDADPAALGHAAIKSAEKTAAAVRISTEEIALTLKSEDVTRSELKLKEDRVEISVPFRFAVAEQPPIEPVAGLVYFDATVKGLRVYDGQEWINLG